MQYMHTKHIWNEAAHILHMSRDDKGARLGTQAIFAQRLRPADCLAGVCYLSIHTANEHHDCTLTAPNPSIHTVQTHKLQMHTQTATAYATGAVIAHPMEGVHICYKAKAQADGLNFCNASMCTLLGLSSMQEVHSAMSMH